MYTLIIYAEHSGFLNHNVYINNIGIFKIMPDPVHYDGEDGHTGNLAS